MAIKKAPSKGMLLESAINAVNAEYLDQGIASVKKIPNAWVVRRKGPQIVGATPVPSGLCDYVGTSHYVGGKTIVFDAKECKLKKQFNLNYIKWEQFDHMTEVEQHGGIAFILVWFTELDEHYALPYSLIKEYWELSEELETPQNIPISVIQERGHDLGVKPYYMHYIASEYARRSKGE